MLPQRGVRRALGIWTSKSVALGSGETQLTFYDSVCGKALFVAPVGRTWDAFYAESVSHGWPSFRPEETVGEHVVIHPGGRMSSVCGTHLGHNLPDSQGDRYCIDLVCVAGWVDSVLTSAANASSATGRSKAVVVGTPAARPGGTTPISNQAAALNGHSGLLTTAAATITTLVATALR